MSKLLHSANKVRNVYAGGRGQLPPLLSSLEAEGARIALQTELFPSLLYYEGAFSGIIDSFVQENFSGDKPPDPQISIVLLRDPYTEHRPSGKEANLPLWKNIYIHRFGLSGNLAPCPGHAQASLNKV